MHTSKLGKVRRNPTNPTRYTAHVTRGRGVSEILLTAGNPIVLQNA